MAVITKITGMRLLADGSWEDVFSPFEGATMAGAEMAYEEWLRETHGYDITMPLGDVAEKFIYSVLIPDRSLKYNTKVNYVNAYRLHMRGAEITRLPLREVRALDLQLFYNRLACPCSVIRALNTVITRLYDFLQLGTEINNIGRMVSVPAPETRRKADVEIWTDDELRDITAHLDENPKIRFLTILLINTGCRISELLALRESDFTGGLLRVEKQLTKKRDLRSRGNAAWYEITSPKSDDSVRSIPVTAAVMDELRRHVSWHRDEMKRRGYETDLLFSSLNGCPVDKRMLSVNFRRYYERIGVPAKSFHVYRHTFGTNLCRAGVPIQVASKLLGHSSVKVTSRYYVNVDDAQKADAIDSLERMMRG